MWSAVAGETLRVISVVTSRIACHSTVPGAERTYSPTAPSRRRALTAAPMATTLHHPGALCWVGRRPRRVVLSWVIERAQWVLSFPVSGRLVRSTYSRPVQAPAGPTPCTYGRRFD